MNTYTIPFAEAQLIWNQTLGSSTEVRLLPGDLIQLWKQTPDTHTRESMIPHWAQFEEGDLDFSNEDFGTWMGIAEMDTTAHLILITDEGWKDQVAFRFLPAEFNAFTTWYESHYQMDFFQSADYILFQASLTTVNILHHEGVVFHLTREVANQM